jgi:hypothetical protein
MLKYSRAVPIRMIGVWDTVGAAGIPVFRIPGVSSSTLGFHHTGLRRPIKYAFHAVAIDEHRRKFAPTLWTVRTAPGAQPAPMRSLAAAEQRWFIGAHANVGGGCYDDLLAQIPLRWMMRKAANLRLAMRNELEVDEGEYLGPISDSYREFFKGAYACVSSRHYRPIAEEPKVAETGTHTNVNETIDASVFERWRADQTYRPPNFVDWVRRLKVDPATIQGSIMANQPTVQAPD